MKTTTLTVVLVALFLGGRMTDGQTAEGMTNAPMTVAELMRLLPSGPDIDSPDDLRNLQTLKSIGLDYCP